jgi:spore germination protein GerM
MNYRNSNPKYRQSDKRRGPSPILKFTLILALIFVAGFFIFYSIDNPGFLKEKISSIRGGSVNDESGGEIAFGPEDSRESMEAGGIQTAVAESEESLKANSENEDNNAGDTGKSLSFWQKIINFITRSGGNEKEEYTYPSSLKINFYFSALGEEKKLVSEERTINAGSPAIAVQNAITELLKGPEEPHNFPVIPAGTELLGVEVSENIAKVDFSQEFLENSLDTRILDEYIIYSIVNTLTEIPDIEGVIFYIEGIRIKGYGNVDLSIPAIRNKDLIEDE